MKIAIYKEKQDVRQALEHLGLTEIDLTEAVKAGYLAFHSCTDNDPLTFPGTAAWAGTTRAFRDRVNHKGWIKDNKHNLPLTCNPETNIAILVSAGDANTGKNCYNPKTKNIKGAKTTSAVKNNDQLLLFPLIQIPLETLIDINKSIGEYKTWMLLYYYATSEIQCELSLPNGIDKSGKIDSWKERILLSSIPISEPDLHHASKDEFAPTPPIIIQKKN